MSGNYLFLAISTSADTMSNRLAYPLVGMNRKGALMVTRTRTKVYQRRISNKRYHVLNIIQTVIARAAKGKAKAKIRLTIFLPSGRR